MKKQILVVLMVVMVATPCLAQEVETDELSSIEGTRWIYCHIGFRIELGSLPFIRGGCDDMAFYQGAVYGVTDDLSECWIDPLGSYFDTPLVSIVSSIFTYVGSYEFAILQPSGFGLYVAFVFNQGSPVSGPVLHYGHGLMFKVDDDWSPYDQPIRCSNSSFSPCPDDMVCVDDYCQ